MRCCGNCGYFEPILKYGECHYQVKFPDSAYSCNPGNKRMVKETDGTMCVCHQKTEPDYKPYMGWCDVKGCKNEACGGGGHWRETGYWLLCLKHMGDCGNGKIQPKMKQEAIDRENSRDKNGYLPNDD